MKTPANPPANPKQPEDDRIPDEFNELPAEERELMAALRQAVQEVKPNARFASELEEQLKERPANPNPLRRALQPLQSATRSLAWVGLVLLFMVGLGWAITTLRPSAGAVGTQPATSTRSAAVTSAPAASPTPTPAAETSPAPTQAAQPGPNGVTSPYLPGDTLYLQASLPAQPAAQTLYQLQSGALLTAESAKVKARQLGIEGHVYRSPSEGSSLVLVVTDGVQRVVFVGSTDTFFYVANYVTAPSGTLNLPSVEAQKQAAESWLQTHHLLDYPYHVQTKPGQPGQVQFVRLLESLPMQYENNQPVGLTVTIDEKGQVKQVDSTFHTLLELQALPLRSSAQAWADLQSGPKAGGSTGLSGPSLVAISSGGVSTSTLQTWLHSYPTGQPIEMFGYLAILQSAESGLPPEITFNNYPLTGDTSSLLQAAPLGQFLQLLGMLQPGPTGGLVFKMSGWQTSAFADESLEGTIERQGAEAFLTGSRGRLRLANLPAQVPGGAQATVRGVVLEGQNPEIDWMFVQTGTNEGGGGGGGSGFKELNLSGNALPTATPQPMPAPGDRVDGMTAYPEMTIHHYPDGAVITETLLGLDFARTRPELGSLTALTEGPGAAGLQAYLRLPVKVWGSFGSPIAGKPALQIERFEPLYPDAHYQAYVGRCQSVTLENKSVIKLTTLDNQVYVLKSSLDYGAGAIVGRPGDLVLVEGVVFPGETFAGLPLLRESGASVVPDQAFINTYQISASRPGVIDEPAPSAGQKLVISRVELVYITPDLRGVGQDLSTFATPLYVQPAWRFSGQYANGTPVTILVQAAAAQYLK